MTQRLSSRDDRAHWEARYADAAEDGDRPPSPWIMNRALALPADTLFVDVAGGTGRHAGPLANAQRHVVLVDFIELAIRTAIGRHDRLIGVVAEAGALPIRPASAGAIICVNYLDRSIFTMLSDILLPGGVLLYETFTLRHLELVASGRARGPRNPAYLLQSDEILGLVAPLVVQEHAEATVVDAVGERSIARVMAVKR
jgi:SAM-dependent methyltransferase